MKPILINKVLLNCLLALCSIVLSFAVIFKLMRYCQMLCTGGN